MVRRGFKLETDKGYWFVGYVGDDLSSGDNFSDSTDNERLIRYSFDITVPAYLVGDGYPTSRKTISRFISAPEINFSYDIPNQRNILNNSRAPLQSVDVNDHIGENFRTLDEALPGQSIGGVSTVTDDSTASVGSMQTDDSYNQFVEFETNPLTGKKEKTTTVVKTNTNRKGETVLREIDI